MLFLNIVRRVSLAIVLSAGPLAAATAPAPSLPLPAMAATVAAHAVGQSYMFLRVYEDSIVVRLEMTVEDVEAGLSFGWDPAAITLAQVESQVDSLRAYVEPKFAISTTDGPLAPRFRGVEVHYLEVTDFVMMTYIIEGTQGIPNALTATYPVLFEIDNQHRNFLIVEHNWKTGTFNSEAIVGVFSPSEPTQTLDLSKSTAWRGFVAMVRQGIWHIWIGLDHILFLVALILPAVLVREEGQWKPVSSFRKALYKIIGIVTFFTLAHSVTLSLAALDVIRLPSRFVESVIAGSIAVAALSNLMPRLAIKEAAIAFAFGLFHGFGFASVLSDIGLGREHLVLSLLGFNIGVEIGQIAIICLIFPVLFLLRERKVYGWILRYGSLALVALALLWVVERVFDVNVPIMGTVRAVLGVG